MSSASPHIPDFEMLRVIGAGSYGDVWIARSLTGIYRAVKVVDRARFKDERPFLREFEGISRFQQTMSDKPRQLALLHVGRDEAQGILYYVMELADDATSGTDIDPERYTPLTLKLLHAQRPVLPAPEVIRLGIDLARALVEMHAAGLIHRDVKPSNIIFVNGVPKLADIGLVSSSDHTLTSLGTPGYAPPEGAGTVKADVFSLGKILYELGSGLDTGDFPRLPSDVAQRDDAALLLELNEVVVRACDPDQGERYDSAQAMLDDLLLLQAGKSVKELVRTKQRLHLLARLTAVAALIALAALGVLGWKNYRAAKALAAQETAARHRAEADERLARYAADMQLTALAVQSGDYGVARSALRRQVPTTGASDLRGPEWRAWWNETAGTATRILGQVGAPGAQALRLSPDARLLAVQNGEARRVTTVWDLQTGTPRTLADDTFGLVGFLESNAFLAVGTAERRVRLLELATGTPRADQAALGRVLGSAQDGRLALLGGLGSNGAQLSLWDVLAEREIVMWDPGPEPSQRRLAVAAVSGDGRWLAASWFRSDGSLQRYELQVFDVASRKVKLRTEAGPRPLSLAFSPDGNVLAVGYPASPIALLSIGENRIETRLAGHSGWVNALAFTADGSRLLSAGSDQSIRLWNTASGGLERLFRGHEASVTALALDRDQERFFSTSADGTAREWSLAAAAGTRRVDGLWSSRLGDFLFSTDGATLDVTDGAGRLSRREVGTLREAARIDAAFHPLARARDGAIIALTKERRLARFAADGAVTPLALELAVGERLGIAFGSESGRVGIFGFDDGRVTVGEFESGVILANTTNTDAPVYALALTMDGATAAAGHRDGRLFVWSENGKVLHEFPKSTVAVHGLAFSPDGQLLAAGFSDGRIEIWNRAERRKLGELRGHSFAVDALAFARDGSRLISGGQEGFLLVWDVAARRHLATLRTVEKGLAGFYRVRPDPTGQWIAAMTEDGVLQVWDTRKRPDEP